MMSTTTRVALIACMAAVGLFAVPAAAEELDVEMNRITADGVGDRIGMIHAYDSENGLVMRMELTGLSPGGHGFHLHETADCGPGQSNGETMAGGAAGGHFDPHGTGKHLGPSGEGHVGDLPVIYVEASEGDATIRRIAVVPRLKVADLRGHALMIHQGGDNYRDEPKKLGGGGGRIACGVVE